MARKFNITNLKLHTVLCELSDWTPEALDYTREYLLAQIARPNNRELLDIAGLDGMSAQMFKTETIDCILRNRTPHQVLAIWETFNRYKNGEVSAELAGVRDWPTLEDIADWFGVDPETLRTKFSRS